ncbi:Zinc finger MYM-type 2 [Paramuricea clavata]|uniref:Zinc finger MYM-type 2 n=1 Tax=Paramuricea clavata TaxID=317549 RepID=A0A6S7GVE7_PARCT|nr:Zinc finger MYM-type 2 [Paramuricea clavata]
MEKAGVNGHFTNHSLRATAVSRLFREGVDDKLIKGVTGHRSEALDCYKRETESSMQMSRKYAVEKIHAGRKGDKKSCTIGLLDTIESVKKMNALMLCMLVDARN